MREIIKYNPEQILDPSGIQLSRQLYENPAQKGTIQLLDHALSGESGVPVIDLPLQGIRSTQFGGLPIVMTENGLRHQLGVGPYRYLWDPMVIYDSEDRPYMYLQILQNPESVFATFMDHVGDAITLDSDPDAVLRASEMLAGLEAAKQAQQYGDVYAVLQMRDQQMVSAFSAMQQVINAGLKNQQQIIQAIEEGKLSDTRKRKWTHQIVEWEEGLLKPFARHTDTETFTDDQEWRVPAGLTADANFSTQFNQGGIDYENTLVIPVTHDAHIQFEQDGKSGKAHGKGAIMTSHTKYNIGPSTMSISVQSGFGRKR